MLISEIFHSIQGEGELTGIVLVNRFEVGPANDEFQWAVPFKVSVSLDGKTWTEVASFDKAEAVFRVDLQGRKLLARYVRAEHLPQCGMQQVGRRMIERGRVTQARIDFGAQHHALAQRAGGEPTEMRMRTARAALLRVFDDEARKVVRVEVLDRRVQRCHRGLEDAVPRSFFH